MILLVFPCFPVLLTTTLHVDLREVERDSTCIKFSLELEQQLGLSTTPPFFNPPIHNGELPPSLKLNSDLSHIPSLPLLPLMWVAWPLVLPVTLQLPCCALPSVSQGLDHVVDSSSPKNLKPKKKKDIRVSFPGPNEHQNGW